MNFRHLFRLFSSGRLGSRPSTVNICPWLASLPTNSKEKVLVKKQLTNRLFDKKLKFSLVFNQKNNMKTKSLLLTVILSLLLVSGAWAQEKYEYAIVEYRPFGYSGGQNSYVSKQDSYEIIPDEKSEYKDFTYFSPLLKVISKMGSEGWEVFSTTAVPGTGSIATSRQFYYLRKKKN